MHKFSFLLLALAVLSLWACDEDSFSQVVDIELPEHDPKTAVRFHFSVQDEDMAVLVSNSKSILNPDSDYKYPDNAEVVLYKNGQPISNFAFSNTDKSYLGTLQASERPLAGDELRLEVKVPGFDDVFGTQVVPTPPSVQQTDYTPDGGVDETGYRLDVLEVTIKDDDPATTNYYMVEIFAEFYQIDFNGDTIGSFENSFYTYSNDPLIVEGSDGKMLFTDESFPGSTYKARLLFDNYYDEDTPLKARISVLSKDAFLYFRSEYQFQLARDNPFAEPVNVHSNVDGGYGIFSACSSLVVSL